MDSTCIYQLDHLPSKLRTRLHDAQMESARVWLACRDLHLNARRKHLHWPNRDDFQKATQGQFALHSQTVQMICHKFLTNIENTKQVRKQNRRIRYPYKDKRFHALYWPAQAVSVERGRVVLPMGRGRPSLTLRVNLPADAGACKIVWNDGYELHVTINQARAAEPPGQERATIDLGEIHQAAVTTTTGVALVVSGRGIRSIKRHQNQALGQIARKRSRCRRGSKRWHKLQHARRKVSARAERQVRDLRHKGIRRVVTFCDEHDVGTVYVGDTGGVRRCRAGRHHNQRMAQWEYGKDIDYLTHKCKQRRIESFTGPEWGTSSRCPACGKRQRKPRGRDWICRNPECGFQGHRDVVGSANMHRIAYGESIPFPSKITYRRPGPVRVQTRNKQPRLVARAGAS